MPDRPLWSGEPAKPDRMSQQFLGMLESLRMPAQFQQGRRYARAGRVRSLSISAAVVTGRILDDDGTVYRAQVGVRTFSAADWYRLERALAKEARYAAKLLAGQLPDDLDDLLASFGLTLLPNQLGDIVLECDCGSWHQPCAHLTAACYALAESFDADPFGLLAWRGRGRDELLGKLRGHRVSALGHVEGEPSRPAPSPPSTAGFWAAGPRLGPPAEAVAGTVHRPDALLEQLDPLGLTAGRFDVTDILRTAYRKLQRPVHGTGYERE